MKNELLKLQWQILSYAIIRTLYSSFCMVRKNTIHGYFNNLCYQIKVVLPSYMLYCSLANERPWAEHLTSPPTRGVGALLRVPMSCLQRLNTLEANNWTNIQQSHQWLQSNVLMARNTLNGTRCEHSFNFSSQCAPY